MAEEPPFCEGPHRRPLRRARDRLVQYGAWRAPRGRCAGVSHEPRRRRVAHADDLLRQGAPVRDGSRRGRLGPEPPRALPRDGALSDGALSDGALTVGPEEQPPPSLADETRWYTEHTALVISTLKWALLGAAAGLCVGFGTRAFLWSLAAAGTWVKRVTPGGISPTWLLPLALPVCVYLVRRFAPTARGHGTEAVIAAIHRDSGRIPWKVAPIKLLATVVTLAFGGSVGKEGPC